MGNTFSSNNNSDNSKKRQEQFLQAVKDGNLELVKQLIKECDVNQLSKEGKTPLFLASQKGHYEIAKLLVQHKAKVNKPNDDSLTPQYNQTGLPRYNETGLTPLHTAALNGREKGRYEVIELLLQNEANVNQPTLDGYGWTPLIFAVGCGSYNTVNLLIQHKANVNQPNKEGQTPLDSAFCNIIDSYRSDDYYDVAQLLIQHGANVNQPDKYLHLASKNGHDKFVDLLIQHKADVNQPEDGVSGWTPLHFASQKGHDKVINILLRNGANANQPDKHGRTPLQLAETKTVIQMLITQGHALFGVSLDTLAKIPFKDTLNFAGCIIYVPGMSDSALRDYCVNTLKLPGADKAYYGISGAIDYVNEAHAVFTKTGDPEDFIYAAPLLKRIPKLIEATLCTLKEVNHSSWRNRMFDLRDKQQKHMPTGLADLERDIFDHITTFVTGIDSNIRNKFAGKAIHMQNDFQKKLVESREKEGKQKVIEL